MNPLRIELTNVRTFPNVSLDLPEGLLAILGTNGAGKSTLISAIDIALFGPEGRSLAPWYPRGGGNDPMTIELLFEHGGAEYRVRRSYSPKGRGQSKLDLEEGDGGFSENDGSRLPSSDWRPLTLESQTATQERIEALIGLSRTTFRASSYLAQGDSGAFCDALPGVRKAILAEVIGLADWDKWLQRARQDKRAAELEIAETRALLDRAADELSQREALADDKMAAVEREQGRRAEHASVVSALTHARLAANEASQAAERRTAAEHAQRAAQEAVDYLRRSIQAREDEIKGIDARLAERVELVHRAERLHSLESARDRLQASVEQWQARQRLQVTLDDLTKRAAEASARSAELEQQAWNVLDGVGREHCDRCGQPLGEEAAQRAAESYRLESRVVNGQYVELHERLSACTAELAELPADEPDATVLASVYDDIRLAQDAHSRLAALDEAANRRDAASLELGEMRAELPTRDRVAADAIAAVEALGPHDPEQQQRERLELQRLERSEAQVREQIELAVREIGRLDERLQRLALIEDEAIAQRARADALLGALTLATAMERACSANGIPALILESIAIPQVEVEATRILRALGGPATAVELRTQRETKTAGIADTLDIVLLTDTGEANYETFSGGEKARIAFALRLSLAQLLSARKGSDTGLLVIDEIDGLDAEGIAALVAVLEALPQSVPRIIVVSHDMNLRDAFSQSLTVENIDGRSRILEPVAAV